MVCQANRGVGHDFRTDPIRPRLEGEWVRADGTTLGADNGVGAALALAMLEAAEFRHGPLEALFTVGEESGMHGAIGLQAGMLTGGILLNLDAESWGDVYVGCAGGVDVEVRSAYAQTPLPQDWRVLQLEVRGLQGGHSGLDIHRGRGNAIQILVRLLQDLEELVGLRLANLEGGTLRNALPREAFATVAVPGSDEAETREAVGLFQELLRSELAGVDDRVTVDCAAGAAERLMAPEDQRRLLLGLRAAPHGVRSMSRQFPGVVETSNNLGVVTIADGMCSADLMVRSLRDSGTRELSESIRSLFLLADADVTLAGAYPGWTPDPESVALELFQRVFRQRHDREARVEVIHAGLECGVIGSKFPGLDMVSFGPTITGAHSPDERVEVASVAACWALLGDLLAAAPVKAARA
jgi:dipeptidase D